MYQLHPPAVIDAEFNPDWFREQVMFNDWPGKDAIRFRIMYVDPSLRATAIRPACDLATATLTCTPRGEPKMPEIESKQSRPAVLDGYLALFIVVAC